MMTKLFFILTLIFISAVCTAAEVKEADLAGSWYPDSMVELTNMLDRYLKAANSEKVDGRIFAIISPHAGYQFSGPVAAYGFKLLQAQNMKTVIIIGFSHRKFFDGISIYNTGSWRTPLGEIGIDEKLADSIIAKNPRIRFNPDLFKDENSVEMQIPFIQLSLKDAKVVPIAFGTQDYEDAEILAQALSAVVKNRKDIVIVASTDLSHYHPYEEANSIDKHFITILNHMKAKELYDDAKIGYVELCGLMPVAATLLAAEKLGFDNVKVLKYANSADTFGNKDNVVGYLSAVIYGSNSMKPAEIVQKGDERMLNDSQRERLLQIARESITSFVRDGRRKQFIEKDPVLNKVTGAFVTLHEGGELRGCIGNMVGHGPLYQTVADMAIEAATGDPRFSSLSLEELDKIKIEISVLSPLRKVLSHEEIRIPGHGVLIRCPAGGGVYLPQVATECGWNKEEFLTSLCAHKAGLPPNAWKDPAAELYIFSAEVFGEKGETK